MDATGTNAAKRSAYSKEAVLKREAEEAARCHASSNRAAVDSTVEAVAWELHRRFIGTEYQWPSCWNDAEAVVRIVRELAT